MPRFQALIIKARKDAGLSQEAAARASGITVSALRKLERGDSSPQERTVRRLADGLQIDLGLLLEAAGFPAEVFKVVARDALKREEEVVTKVEQFVDRYEELGHTYRRIDERTEILDRRVEDFHASAEQSVKAVNRRMLAFERKVELLGTRLEVIEKNLGELTDLIRSQSGRSRDDQPGR